MKEKRKADKQNEKKKTNENQIVGEDQNDPTNLDDHQRMRAEMKET